MNFRSAGFLAQPRPPGRGRIFGAATPPGALVHVKKVTVTFFFAPHALACRRKVQRDMKIAVPLCTAVLQLPSKSYENRRKRSGIVQLSRNRSKRPTRTGIHPVRKAPMR